MERAALIVKPSLSVVGGVPGVELVAGVPGVEVPGPEVRGTSVGTEGAIK